MTVRELMEQLQKSHPDDDVRISVDVPGSDSERVWATALGVVEITANRLGEIVIQGEAD